MRVCSNLMISAVAVTTVLAGPAAAQQRPPAKVWRYPSSSIPHQAIYNNLTKLRGTNFDRASMKQMIEDHDKTVKLFQMEVQKGADQDLQRFAETTLTTINEHDKMGAGDGKN